MTEDSNFVLFCLFIPFFLFGCVALIAAAAPIIAPILLFIVQAYHYAKMPKVVTRVQTETVYKDRIVYRDRPVSTPKPPIPTTTKPKKQKAKPPRSENDNQIIKDVVAGLSNLGLKKKDAKSLVAKFCNKKTYTDAKDLLEDCLATF